MRLVEHFFEVFYYTSFLRSLDFSQLPYESVAKRYKQLLTNSLNSAKRAGYTEKNWGNGLFPVCAWVDETVLCSDWEDREKWQQTPLQLVFFKTMNAGEEFFARLNALDPDARDIREVYDYCLTIGYRGKYFQPKDEGVLREIALANLARITGDSGLELPRVYFPEAYAWPEEHRTKRPLAFRVSLLTLTGIILPVAVFVTLLFYYGRTLGGAITAFLRAGF